jgi:hypothetical protein
VGARQHPLAVRLAGALLARLMQPQPSRAAAAHLDRNADKRLAVTLAATAKIGVASR